MESKNELKEIEIKNCTCYYFDYVVNNYAYNYFPMIGHAQYAHQKKKRRFMRVKPCKFYMQIIIISV